MILRYLLLTSTCLFAQGPRWDEHPTTTERAIYRGIIALELGSAPLIGNFEQYGFSHEYEIEHFLQTKFSEYNLDPYPTWDQPAMPALLDFTLTAQNNIVLIQAELTDDAAFLNSRTFVLGTIWKKQTILSADDHPDMKASIFAQVNTFADEILSKYSQFTSLGQ